MYAQQINGIWQELSGNIVFSPTVYQTAESLSDEQRIEFGVYPLDQTPQPEFDYDTQIAERTGYLFDETTQRVSVVWNVRDLTAEEKRARIPSVVTMRQGRLAMLQTPYGETTLLAMVDSTLAAIEDPIQRQAAQIDWEFAAEINRNFPLVQQLSSALNLTEEQLDDLFKLASTL